MKRKSRSFRRTYRILQPVLAVLIILLVVDVFTFFVSGIAVNHSEMWEIIKSDITLTWKKRIIDLLTFNFWFIGALICFVRCIIDKKFDGINWHNIQKNLTIIYLSIMAVFVNLWIFLIGVIRDNWDKLWTIGVETFNSTPAIVIIITADFAIMLVIIAVFKMAQKQEEKKKEVVSNGSGTNE